MPWLMHRLEDNKSMTNQVHLVLGLTMSSRSGEGGLMSGRRPWLRTCLLEFDSLLGVLVSSDGMCDGEGGELET
jgi:hypothetical protein